jgi:CheY-like chemotaxis protein
MPLETNLNGSDALSRGTGPSVLVIEEDPALRRLLRRELTRAGYRVQDVEPGQTVLGVRR